MRRMRASKSQVRSMLDSLSRQLDEATGVLLLEPKLKKEAKQNSNPAPCECVRCARYFAYKSSTGSLRTAIICTSLPGFLAFRSRCSWRRF